LTPVDEGGLAPLDYHEATKHDFGRFAPSLGYLDWEHQPNPFRRFEGAPLVGLPHDPGDDPAYDDMFAAGRVASRSVDLQTLGAFLRCGLGLSAWKSYGRSRWALRVNPSSGNLHPTEAYLVWRERVYHYAPDAHALETRAIADDASRDDADSVIVVLTSVHWREAWKYGERAFRYCQHDVGHALGALRLSAARLGWSFEVQGEWSHAQMAHLVGLDRDEDFADAEPEEPALVARLSSSAEDGLAQSPERMLAAFANATWSGRASRLSTAHHPWPLIDRVARSTRSPGGAAVARPRPARAEGREHARPISARSVILGRRSATAYDPRGSLRAESFLAMLDRLRPTGMPWDARRWNVRVHLVLFVHRVPDLPPGMYAFVREPDGTVGDWRQAMRPEFLWEPVAPERGVDEGLFLLAPIDVRSAARRLSCDQDIAGDGFFSAGMLASVEAARTAEPWAYRQMFWECGLVGQVLYLEAEALGARGTGIGCFYDDRVHEALGLRDRRWQSLYHFSAGLPLDDARLTSEPGYPWEVPAR